MDVLQNTTIWEDFLTVFWYTEIAARETLEQVMAEALSKSGCSRSAVRAVCLAVSGVNHPTDQQRILDWLRSDYTTSLHLCKFYITSRTTEF